MVQMESTCASRAKESLSLLGFLGRSFARFTNGRDHFRTSLVILIFISESSNGSVFTEPRFCIFQAAPDCANACECVRALSRSDPDEHLCNDVVVGKRTFPQRQDYERPQTLFLRDILKVASSACKPKWRPDCALVRRTFMCGSFENVNGTQQCLVAAHRCHRAEDYRPGTRKA